MKLLNNIFLRIRYLKERWETINKLVFLLFIFSSISFVFSQTYYLNVDLKNGIKVTYDLADISKIDLSYIPSNVKDTKKLEEIVKSLKLRQNFPNPFNPSTTIQYVIPKSGKVEISILDLNGRLIKKIIDKNQQHVGH